MKLKLCVLVCEKTDPIDCLSGCYTCGKLVCSLLEVSIDCYCGKLAGENNLCSSFLLLSYLLFLVIVSVLLLFYCVIFPLSLTRLP